MRLRPAAVRLAMLLCAIALTNCASRDVRVAHAPRSTDAQATRDARAEKTRVRPDAPAEWAEFQRSRRLAPGMVDLPVAAYREAAERVAKMPRHQTLGRSDRFGDFQSKSTAQPAWQFLGPTNVTGRTRTLVFDPRNPNRMFAGGVSGGVWLSEDGGATWAARGDAALTLNIGALVIDPVEPDVMYAGTGELYRNSQQPYATMWGQGVLKSTDGGRTWQQLAATANENFRYVSDIAISSHDHRHLYVASNTGVWRSHDGGARFSRIVLLSNNNGGYNHEGCTDLLMLPHETKDRLIASCASRSLDDRYVIPGITPPLPATCNGPCPAAVVLIDDAGGDSISWRIVLNEPAMGRTTLDYARSDPSIVYAVSASIQPGFDRNGDGAGDYDNGLHAIWRSTDGGSSWEARLRNNASDALSTYLLSYADGFEAQRCGFGAPFIYGAGWYNQAIAVDPVDPNIVWVAGMDIYRSDDGGASFGMAAHWFSEPGTPHYVHADQHLIRFHPQFNGSTNQRLFVTNDGGVAVTDAARAPVSRGIAAACGPTRDDEVPWRTSSFGMGTVQFYTGSVSADGSVYFAGAQDNGTLLNRSNLPPSAWRFVFGGDGATTAIDPSNPNRIYFAYQNVNLYRSDNGGDNPVRIVGGIADQTIFIAPYILDPNQPDRLYLGGTRLWRTDNRGTTWRVASASFGGTFTDRVSALAVAPNNANRMLVGNQRAIFRNGNALASVGGTAWASTSPRTGWVSSLAFDPVDSNIAYATYSTFGGAHVWRSADAGATWTPIDGTGNGQLPDVPVHSLAIDPGNRQRLYIGTDVGVFVSVDGGAHWAVENTGFASVITETLKVAPGNDTTPPQLFAFTYGRGAWKVPLADLDGVTNDYVIGAATSGAFYDPLQDGHGLLIETIPNANGTVGMLATWYTYLDGVQQWMIGVGTVNGNEARIPLSITSGGQFPPLFNPADVNLQPWGELVLRFDDADHASASWTTGYPGFTSGSMPLTRLTSLAAPTNESPVARIAPCHGGTWYNPQQNGHGAMVQVLGPPENRRMLLAWYTYLERSQRWLLGVGPVAGDTATLDTVITEGADFPPDFDPADVARTPWGTIRFRAVDANRAVLDWTSGLPDFPSGSLELTRLTTQLGNACPQP